MTRRFSESHFSAVSSAAPVAAPYLPGFVACNISTASQPIQQLWHAVYQAAFAQAMMKAMLDAEPSKYQRLVYRVCQN